MPTDRVTVVADELSQGTWTHDHPISQRDAEKLGLPVKSDMPEDVYKLMSLFPQPTMRQPAVHYIPGPHSRPSVSPEGKKM
jgi:hypothetical protein